MNKIFVSLLFIMSLTVSFPAFCQSNIDSLAVDSSNAAAEYVVNQYFSALASGDTLAMETLLGGKLLAKRKKLLKNPTYGGHLRKTYANALFTILNYKNHQASSMDVEVLIDFGKGEKIKKILLMQKTDPENNQTTYYIANEISVY